VVEIFGFRLRMKLAPFPCAVIQRQEYLITKNWGRNLITWQ
jgi:hypothetical protein